MTTPLITFPQQQQQTSQSSPEAFLIKRITIAHFITTTLLVDWISNNETEDCIDHLSESESGRHHHHDGNSSGNTREEEFESTGKQQQQPSIASKIRKHKSEKSYSGSDKADGQSNIGNWDWCRDFTVSKWQKSFLQFSKSFNSIKQVTLEPLSADDELLRNRRSYTMNVNMENIFKRASSSTSSTPSSPSFEKRSLSSSSSSTSLSTTGILPNTLAKHPSSSTIEPPKTLTTTELSYSSFSPVSSANYMIFGFDDASTVYCAIFFERTYKSCNETCQKLATKIASTLASQFSQTYATQLNEFQPILHKLGLTEAHVADDERRSLLNQFIPFHKTIELVLNQHIGSSLLPGDN